MAGKVTGALFLGSILSYRTKWMQTLFIHKQIKKSVLAVSAYTQSDSKIGIWQS